jgi:hypothetical protein
MQVVSAWQKVRDHLIITGGGYGSWQSHPLGIAGMLVRISPVKWVDCLWRLGIWGDEVAEADYASFGHCG